MNIIRSHVYSIGHEYESNIYLLLEIGAASGGGDCLVAVERLFDLSITTRLVIRGATQTLSCCCSSLTHAPPSPM